MCITCTHINCPRLKHINLCQLPTKCASKKHDMELWIFYYYYFLIVDSFVLLFAYLVGGKVWTLWWDSGGRKIIVDHFQSFCWSFAFLVNSSDLSFIFYEIADLITNEMIRPIGNIQCIVCFLYIVRMLRMKIVLYFNAIKNGLEDSSCRRLQAFASIKNEYLKFEILNNNNRIIRSSPIHFNRLRMHYYGSALSFQFVAMPIVSIISFCPISQCFNVGFLSLNCSVSNEHEHWTYQTKCSKKK